jgi:hypothetical protein
VTSVCRKAFRISRLGKASTAIFWGLPKRPHDGRGRRLADTEGMTSTMARRLNWAHALRVRGASIERRNRSGTAASRQRAQPTPAGHVAPIQAIARWDLVQLGLSMTQILIASSSVRATGICAHLIERAKPLIPKGRRLTTKPRAATCGHTAAPLVPGCHRDQRLADAVARKASGVAKDTQQTRPINWLIRPMNYLHTFLTNCWIAFLTGFVKTSAGRFTPAGVAALSSTDGNDGRGR